MTDDGAGRALSAGAAGARSPIRRIGDLLKLSLDERARILGEMTPRGMRRALLRLDALGPSRPGAAARRLDRLADPRRARRRQDPRRRRGGAAMVVDLPDRQPDRPDRRRRARRDGARRIRACSTAAARTSGRAISPPPAGSNGRTAPSSFLFSAEEPDRLRGKQHMKLWLRRTRRLAAARRVRPGDARPAARRQAADGRHHHAAADQDHQAARRRQGHDRHPRLDLRQPRPPGARLSRAHRQALRGARHRPAGAVRRDRRGDAGRLVDARADRAPARRAGGGAAGIRRGRGRGRSAGALGLEGRRMRPRSSPPRRPTGGSMCSPT